MDRRARLIAGLTPWAADRPRYRLTIGGARIPFGALTDEALAELRALVARDWWAERRLNRENRAVHAGGLRVAA